MPSMKVTVSAAMRARDVSRPQPQHEAAAEEHLAAARPGPSPRARIGPPPARGTGARPASHARTAVPPAAPRTAGRPSRDGPEAGRRPGRGRSGAAAAPRKPPRSPADTRTGYRQRTGQSRWNRPHPANQAQPASSASLRQP